MSDQGPTLYVGGGRGPLALPASSGSSGSSQVIGITKITGDVTLSQAQYSVTQLEQQPSASGPCTILFASPPIGYSWICRNKSSDPMVVGGVITVAAGMSAIVAVDSGGNTYRVTPDESSP
jgi:hypothetical protein